MKLAMLAFLYCAESVKKLYGGHLVLGKMWVVLEYRSYVNHTP